MIISDHDVLCRVVARAAEARAAILPGCSRDTSAYDPPVPQLSVLSYPVSSSCRHLQHISDRGNGIIACMHMCPGYTCMYMYPYSSRPAYGIPMSTPCALHLRPVTRGIFRLSGRWIIPRVGNIIIMEMILTQVRACINDFHTRPLVHPFIVQGENTIRYDTYHTRHHASHPSCHLGSRPRRRSGVHTQTPAQRLLAEPLFLN